MAARPCDTPCPCVCNCRTHSWPGRSHHAAARARHFHKMPQNKAYSSLPLPSWAMRADSARSRHRSHKCFRLRCAGEILPVPLPAIPDPLAGRSRRRRRIFRVLPRRIPNRPDRRSPAKNCFQIRFLSLWRTVDDWSASWQLRPVADAPPQLHRSIKRRLNLRTRAASALSWPPSSRIHFHPQ